MDRLQDIVESCYREMSSRVHALETRDLERMSYVQSIGVDRDSISDQQLLEYSRSSFDPDIGTDLRADMFPCQYLEELQKSWVYRRMSAFRHSTFTSSQYSTKWSCLSALTMSDVSNISVINLAINVDEVKNSQRLSQTWSNDQVDPLWPSQSATKAPIPRTKPGSQDADLFARNNVRPTQSAEKNSHHSLDASTNVDLDRRVGQDFLDSLFLSLHDEPVQKLGDESLSSPASVDDRTGQSSSYKEAHADSTAEELDIQSIVPQAVRENVDKSSERMGLPMTPPIDDETSSILTVTDKQRDENSSYLDNNPDTLISSAVGGSSDQFLMGVSESTKEHDDAAYPCKGCGEVSYYT